MPKREKVQPESTSESRVRLPEQETPPEAKLISKMLNQAKEERGRLIELPWTIADGLEFFSLTVQHDKNSEAPIWTLYQGKGTNSCVIWSCTEADLELISDVVYMFCSSAEKKFLPQEEGKESQELPGVNNTVEVPTVDYEALKQKANVLLGHMLVEAELVTEPILEEALKLQELVRNESLTIPQAIEALKRASARRAPDAHEDLDNEASLDTAQAKPNTNIKQILDFLKQAGLLSQADLDSLGEEEERIEQRLLASGKIDKLTLQAAKSGCPMVQDNQIRPEQAIIALHYCIRSRVSFQDALNELGFS